MSSVSLDEVPHASPFGQFIKSVYSGPYTGRVDVEEFAQVIDLVAPHAPIDEPQLSTWSTPASCAEAWDRRIEANDFASALFGWRPDMAGDPSYEGIVEAVFERDEEIRKGEELLGCDSVGLARYQLEVASQRSATDYWDSLAKRQLSAAAFFVVLEPFLPALYPDAVAQNVSETASALLRAESAAAVESVLAAAELEAPAGYKFVVDLPQPDLGVGGVVIALPNTHQVLTLNADQDYQQLQLHDRGLAEYAETNRSLPHEESNDRLVSLVAYLPTSEQLDSIQVAVLPGAWSQRPGPWSHYPIVEFFDEAHPIDTPAGIAYWNDIELLAAETFTDTDVRSITYL